MKVLNGQDKQELRERWQLEAMTEFLESKESAGINVDWLFPRFHHLYWEWEGVRSAVKYDRDPKYRERVDRELEDLMEKLV